MIRLLVNGIQGQMGHAIERAIDARPSGIELVGGVDLLRSPRKFPVFSEWSAIVVPFDVVIDFSVPDAAMLALSYCIEYHKPIVIGTTGLKDAHRKAIEAAAKQIPVFCTGNMSLGINLMRALCRQASLMLGDEFDVEIIEKHHNRKIDAPSGTAVMLANAVMDTASSDRTLVYGRQDSDRRREPNEIGIHSVRGGTIVGEHEVWFMGEDEAVVLRHQAFSKRVFATGALRAAKYLLTKEPGLYSMDDLVAEL